MRIRSATKKRPWRTEEDTFLKEHYREQTDFEVAQALGRSNLAVSFRRRQLSLRKNFYPRQRVHRAKDLTHSEAALLHAEAMKLRERSPRLGARRIGAILGVTHKAVHHWIYQGGIPHRSMAYGVDLSASAELAYLAGAVLGDGTLYYRPGRNGTEHGVTYQIRLRVKDRDFAEQFAAVVARLRGRAPNHVRLQKDGLWCAEVQSKPLFQYLKGGDFSALTDAYPTAFLRGLFDAEGSIVNRGRIALRNTDTNLLSFAQELLAKEGIKSRIYHMRRGHSESIKGVRIKSRRPCYSIQINSQDSQIAFFESVGFSIERKRSLAEYWLKRHKTNVCNSCGEPLPERSPRRFCDTCRARKSREYHQAWYLRRKAIGLKP